MTLRIRTKIILSFGSVFLIFSLIGFLAYYNRNIIFNSLLTLEEQSDELTLFSDLRLELDMLLMPVNDYLITGDRKEAERFRQSIVSLENRLTELNALKNHNGHSSQKFKNETIMRFGLLKEKGERVFALKNPVGNTEGVRLMKEADALAEKIIREDLDRLYLSERTVIAKEVESAMGARRRVDNFLLAGAILSVITLVSVSLYLFRSIILPMIKFRESAQKIRSGDLRHRIYIKDGLEVNLLADEFNKMAEQLLESYEDLERKVEERTTELNEANQKLKELAITDGLTGAFNHRHFYERLEEEMKRAERYERKLSLIMMDIDHFKHYNDRNGHPAGDKVLKGVAQCISRKLRDQDVIARYGGEEFAVILPETDADGAVKAAERIRLSVQNETFPNEEFQPGGDLTISLGIAVFPENGEDSKALLKSADEALYRAKELGRNRHEGPFLPPPNPGITITPE